MFNKPTARPGSAMITEDILQKAKLLATPNIISKIDLTKVEKLAGVSQTEIDFKDHSKFNTLTKSNY